jgi:hypothetical protein
MLTDNSIEAAGGTMAVSQGCCCPVPCRYIEGEKVRPLQAQKYCKQSFLHGNIHKEIGLTVSQG